jgi:hypothetical protein
MVKPRLDCPRVVAFVGEGVPGVRQECPPRCRAFRLQVAGRAVDPGFREPRLDHKMVMCCEVGLAMIIQAPGRPNRSRRATPSVPAGRRKPIATSDEQRRALNVLAGCQRGCTVANMLAHGFTNAMLNGLVREGLAIIEPGTVCTGSRRITVVWVAITNLGREVIAA